MPNESRYYRLAPGVDVVPVGDDAVLFRSDAVLLRLDGPSAIAFAERVVPLLDGRRSVAEVAAALGGLSVAELRPHLESLAEARVLARGEGPLEEPESGPEAVVRPFHALLEALGAPLDRATERLRGLHVIVFGLDGPGAFAADALARAGVGRLTLVDPYPWRAADRMLAPLSGPATPGEPRHAVVARALAGVGSATSLDTFEARALEREDVRELARDAAFLVGSFDRAFAAAHQWINRASLEFRIPAVFGELRGGRIVAGPLVIPQEGACYLCWRMRAMACESDFRDAMAYEEYLDGLRAPAALARPAFPPGALQLGGMLAAEVLRTALALGRPALAGRVHELDLLTGDSERHTVLQRPDCPACRKKAATPPAPVSLQALAVGEPPASDLLNHAALLVDRRCGVVRVLESVVKDPSEPALPYVVRSELANHRFVAHEDEASMPASGKGLTLAEARRSALGEALERYCGSMWTGEGAAQGRRAELTGPSLDPRRLVLYRDEQYAGLPYARYTDGTTLGWVPARALASGDLVWVPAVAVYMAHDARPRGELLFAPTSNGLAAGPTLADAVLSAAYEVLERDAFLITWLDRLPARRLDPTTHPDGEVVALCRLYQRRGVALELYRLVVDHPVHVFLGLGVASGDDGPAMVVGLGADLDAARAARGALLEVGQVRPALRIKLRNPETARRCAELVERPAGVASLEDHDLLYASPRMRGSFDFLRCRPIEPFEWPAPPPQGAARRLELLADALAGLGTDLLYCDVTSDDIRPLGVHTTRAIVPDFQPIYFGEQERRIGGDRLYELPRRLGLRPDRVPVAELNPDPHPLA